MAGIEINVNTQNNNVPRLIAMLPQEADRMTGDMAEKIRDAAQGHAPVDTGHLKSKIRVEGAGSSRTVVSDTGDGSHREYAAYNEYGTRYMAAQPYMMPGFLQAMGQIGTVLGAAVGRIEGVS